MRILNKIIIIILPLLFLAGCASSKKPFDTTNVCDLQKLNQDNTSPEFPASSQIRTDALKDTALTIGAQGALAKRSRDYDQMLNKSENKLDLLYNFNGLMLDNNILPPVLVEADQTLTLDDPNTIHLSDKIYKIIKQAHFVTTPPTWRDYLWMDYKKPEIPDSTLLPRDDDERAIWVKYINIGWENGLKQADNMYQNNLATLQRDFKGMMLYRTLLAANMVTKPHFTSANMGITSNSDKTEMNINDQMLVITATPKFNVKSNQWNPVTVYHEK